MSTSKEKDSKEKIEVRILENQIIGAKAAANEIALLIRKKQQQGLNCVLGLATGSTPEIMYADLIRMYKRGELSFENVITFNLDEYYPMNPNAEQSYHSFMKEQLFDHVDIKPENTHVPDGTVAEEDIQNYGQLYDRKIAAAGGIDLQILGIGNNGHIGFNEPGSSKESMTRLIALDENTRQANARNFSSLEEVPHQAITMGIGSILKAKRIILMAWGEKKAEAVKKSLQENATEKVPASLLQNHDNCMFILDQKAAEKL